MTKNGLPQNPSRRTACGSIFLSAAYLASKAYAIEDAQTAPSYFMLPGDFDIESLKVDLPPPDNVAEARLVLAMQSHRTAVQIAQIKAQAINPLPLFWQCAGLYETSHPEQARRIQEAVVDTEYVVTALKRRFNRPRPSTVLADIHTVVPVPPYASYPSGHATQSVVIATLMSEVAPKAAKRLQVLATQVGRNREIAGLHYPSDTVAGFKLGHELSKIFLCA
ncbi:MAG TPA: phosphatase PAP2 family protein [Burkholderiaceae bacterium]|jgi:acid phosphatase (class A)